MQALTLSQQLLHAVKTNQPVDELLNALDKKSFNELQSELGEISTRKTFWINAYNAFVQMLAKEQQPDFSSTRTRITFFGNKCIRISGQLLSLNDIEHGMLRHSSFWWGLGYLKKFYANRFEQKMRVPLDFRIHFALNCGAAACPAISFYDAENIDDQLDAAMKTFLETDVVADEINNTVFISSIFSWYRGDFGGKKGIQDLLQSQHVIAADRKITFSFKAYDWTTTLANYSSR